MSLPFLILLQFVWASSYVAQKLALGEMPLGLVMVLRYGIAAFFFLLIGRLHFRNRFTAREWGLILFAGIINFTASPFFQLKALTLTYAVDVSILVAFEPLMTALVAVAFLGERVRFSTLITFCIATVGVVAMSWQNGAGPFVWARLIGDFLFLAALLCEASCSGTCKYLTEKPKNDPLAVIAWMIFTGFAVNLVIHGSLITPQNLAAIHSRGWMALFYMAILCSCLGYGGWVYLMKKIPLNQLALSLFLQPLFGSIVAIAVLKEPLHRQTLFGGSLVLFSLFIWMGTRLKAVAQNRNQNEGEERKIGQPENAET
ncbi:MAG: DMT family transporter [Deltaproteobacteria bacterium]|nr:DMT family transporter [Deltaproteobacteria bacterium]MDZ4224349.1 DMT family transporter [bacterium]